MATGADDSRRTIEDPGAPRLKRLQQAHQRISECLAEFESAGGTDAILASLEQLLELLPEHFSRDEEGPDGIFNELRTLRPALDRQIGHLEHEHREILRDLEALRSQAREPGHEDARIQEQRAACVRKMRAHEETEDRLALEAYFLDEGGSG
jgi:chromosome segregation ATPase